MVTWRAQQTDTVDRFQFPFYLYIVPFNSTAAIRKFDKWDPSATSGSELFFDFPPLPASTPYILGVVDSAGKGVGSSSQILTVHTTNDSNSTFCLSPPNLLSQPTTLPSLAIATAGSSQDCPSVSLAFQSNGQLPRALIFSPGERPLNMLKSSSTMRHGFVRASGFTSLSQAVVVFQPNDDIDDNNNNNSFAFTSSLMTIGGNDSMNCEIGGVRTTPTALRGGTVIAYTLAAAFATALVTALLVYIHHLRRRASAGPCVPEKDFHALTHRQQRRRPKSSLLGDEDRDLEAARLVPLPPSTVSLVSQRESSVSAIIPIPPRPSPVSPIAVAVPNVLPGDEAATTTVRPTSRHQSSELGPPSLGSRPTARTSVSIYDHHPHHPHHHHHHHHNSPIHNTSPTEYSIITGTRRPSYTSYEANSGRPSTYLTNESGIMFEDSSGNTRTNTNSQYIPRPDSPTLPEIPAPSPFNLSLRLERLSRGSSKKSPSVNEKRSMYLKMPNDDEDGSGGGNADAEGERRTGRAGLFALSHPSSSSRRSRSLGRTKSNSSRKSKKRRPSLPDVVHLNV